MPVDLHEAMDGKLLIARLTGKLAKDDYEAFAPEVERLIGRHGKIRVLVELADFHGWTAGALWEDLKFDLKHFSDVERLAIIGESSWQKGMAYFCKPFTTAEVRYFEPDAAEQALDWLECPEEVRAAVRGGAS